ncbi:MAG: GNAT family N-acetyltransferase [Acidobacteria bacterium]|nr:MAG: GNAT family N-acetyltransferase [Acidobacteriota bacterium]
MLRSEIRLLEKHEEYKKCEYAQRAIWGSLSVAAEVMLVTQKSGGAVLGAFINGRLVGFVYALLARRNGEIVHWSHMMGILPGYRSRGLGLRLKLAHRELALSQGIKSICWTYDPLQSRNASLNLSKLGARVEEYVINYYGRFHSIIEQGLPSDRFVVKWPIASGTVAQLLAGGKKTVKLPHVPKINLTTTNHRGFLVNQEVNLSRREAGLLVEIPADTDLMRAKALALAKRWRIQTREIFLGYFSKGYSVRGFLTENQNSSSPRCFYLLLRK